MALRSPLVATYADGASSTHSLYGVDCGGLRWLPFDANSKKKKKEKKGSY
jgi:hypothetical protein